MEKSESLFNKALELAQKQETTLFELRAAMSLNRLWQQNGKLGKGIKILKDAYNKFTEGFTTIDLIEAKKLLEAIA
jgi:predicted ATPase